MPQAPWLSVISAARNDGYGERFRERFLMHLTSVNAFASALGGHVEHVLVDWNPVDGAPLAALADLVPPGANLERRVVREDGPAVAAAVAARGRPFVEALAKNAGIGQARGDWACLCNSDVALTLELGLALGSVIGGMPSRAFFVRADRLDIVPLADDDLLALSRVRHAIPRASVLHRRHDPDPVLAASIPVAGLKDSELRDLCSPPRASDLVLGPAFISVDESGFQRGLHTNASGDFLVAPVGALRRLGGMNQDIELSTHIDSLLVAGLYGVVQLAQVILRWPAVVVHVEHDREDGYGTGSVPFSAVEPTFVSLMDGHLD